ncbi:sensor histidine kinase [Prauserella cavernicola]|uniref:histidine kinase n=1 Tax=Prauserella cavernicola TaxID=2800127 RepID=A0A934QZS9_9PSEU|nr:histidine kinase [Prauserella cavernicola]MBK1789245.1 sensor histidine kinase [Prauserella cavernicola]
MKARGRRRAAVLLDVAIWLAVCALCVEETRDNAAPWELIGGLVSATVAMATARRLPVVSLTAASLSGIAVLFDYSGRFPIWPVLLMMAAGYFAGRRMPTVRPALFVFSGVALAGVPVSLVVTDDGVLSWPTLPLTLLFAGFVPWHLGRYVRLREDLVSTGWDRAEQLEAQQRSTAEQARLRERARIASDMHDSLGHELSLIALRAGALELAPELAQRHRAAAGELRESAGIATERLREIIGVLREDAPPVDPVGGSLTDLVERTRASGLVVEALVDDGAAPPMVERAAYRVVQESLTNAAKHAPGAAVTVRVRRGQDETLVTVHNGAPDGEPEPAASGQRGLAGLRERVRLLGGTLRAERSDDGFEVAARLPHHAEPGSREPADGASESARQLAHARRQVRRTLVGAVVIPAAAVFVLVAVSAVYYVFNIIASTLDAEDYERLHLGQSRADIELVLPNQERLEPPEAVEPSGAVCEYYGTDGGVLGWSGDAYQLCFADARLVSKERIFHAEGDET